MLKNDFAIKTFTLLRPNISVFLTGKNANGGVSILNVQKPAASRAADHRATSRASRYNL